MIESPQNEKLKLVRKLRERKHREREGLFATEGEDLLEAGLAAGAEPRFVLVPSGSEIAVDEVGLKSEEVEPSLLGGVSSLGSGTRVIAVWSIPSGDRTQLSPHTGDKYVRSPCLYLHGVGDPGNVGTIVRTAFALIDGPVVLGPDCADPFSPKAVRASMGSVFARPPARSELASLPGARLALDARADGVIADVRLSPPLVICAGAERDGLPTELLEAADARARVPIRADGPDSLNVAMAVTVALYELGNRMLRP